MQILKKEPNRNSGAEKLDGGDEKYNREHQLFLLFRFSVVSNSLPPHGLQHARLPLPYSISQSLLRFMSTESLILSNIWRASVGEQRK